MVATNFSYFEIIGLNSNPTLAGPNYTRVPFIDFREFLCPFFDILYAEDASKDHNLNAYPPIKQALLEIEFIRRNFPYLDLSSKVSPQSIPIGLPKNLPILVCGFFAGAKKKYSVDEHLETLLNAGYEAYISKQGTCILDLLPLNTI